MYSKPEPTPPPRRRPLPWHEGQVQVLRALHFAGRASRRELADRSGLSPQSLTRIAQELLSLGHIEEVSRRRTGGMGQPAIELRISPGRVLALGLVLEHDRVTCVLSDLTEGVIRREQARGDFRTAEKTVAMAERLLTRVLEGVDKAATLLGLGVSQSGFFFDPAAQRVVALNDVEGWTRMDLGARLAESFGLDVFIENDGRAAAIGHLVHGVGTQFDDFFVVLMTYRIGGGGVVNRRIIRGWSGNAGEMPRDEGMRASVSSLSEHLGLAHIDDNLEAAVQQAMTDEDPRLTEWLTVSAAKLQKQLLSICSVLDPEAVIFSGRLPLKLREALAERIRLPGHSLGTVSTPGPQIVVDPAVDCLEIGAAALPIARVFTEARRPMID
jgi:predicted NBD/HSP70 family sugar kinase